MYRKVQLDAMISAELTQLLSLEFEFGFLSIGEAVDKAARCTCMSSTYGWPQQGTQHV